MSRVAVLILVILVITEVDLINGQIGGNREGGGAPPGLVNRLDRTGLAAYFNRYMTARKGTAALDGKIKAE